MNYEDFIKEKTYTSFPDIVKFERKKRIISF